MITILIVSNLILIGAWLLTWRNAYCKSKLLETDFKWRKTGNGYEHFNNKHDYLSLRDAAKKQKLLDDCYRLRVPHPEAEKYISESWKQE